MYAPSVMALQQNVKGFVVVTAVFGGHFWFVGVLFKHFVHSDDSVVYT